MLIEARKPKRTLWSTCIIVINLVFCFENLLGRPIWIRKINSSSFIREIKFGPKKTRSWKKKPEVWEDLKKKEIYSFLDRTCWTWNWREGNFSLKILQPKFFLRRIFLKNFKLKNDQSTSRAEMIKEIFFLTEIHFAIEKEGRNEGE